MLPTNANVQSAFCDQLLFPCFKMVYPGETGDEAAEVEIVMQEQVREHLGIEGPLCVARFCREHRLGIDMIEHSFSLDAREDTERLFELVGWHLYAINALVS